MTTPNHLVIVCGHAIWLGGPKKGFDESEWLIESYKSGETPTFIEHIKAGIKILSEDDGAVVMFSGGPTRQETQLSEARSYANLAAVNDYFGFISPHEGHQAGREEAAAAHLHSPIPLHHRVMVEERALDSYYNILFSLVQFWRNHDCRFWPQRMTIVSHGFKRVRLVDSHCAAIAFPLDRVGFVGINPPNLPADLLAADTAGKSAIGLAKEDDEVSISREKVEAMKGAREVVGHWMEDPHGVGSLLAGKRRKRNLWDVDQMLFQSEEERRISGIETQFIDGGMEALVDGHPRPWV